MMKALTHFVSLLKYSFLANASRLSFLAFACLCLLLPQSTAADEPWDRQVFQRPTSHYPLITFDSISIFPAAKTLRGRGMFEKGYTQYLNKVVNPTSTYHLENEFTKVSFLLQSVIAGNRTVPRISVTQFPHDIKKIEDTQLRKKLFIKSILPLVLLANEEIRHRRTKLIRLLKRLEAGDNLSRLDQSWLLDLGAQYEIEDSNFAAILDRVDTVPASLAMAQAIVESGWGTSRFALEGNALFGQKTSPNSLHGISPTQAPQHSLKAFPNLMESVRSYMHNLNTHRAYRDFRKKRAALRLDKKPLNTDVLALTLTQYAELASYPKRLLSLVRTNKLHLYDSVSLDPLVLDEANAGAPSQLSFSLQ